MRRFLSVTPPVPQLLRDVGATLASIVSLRANAAAATTAIGIFRRNRALVVELARRDLGSQFRGQALGSFWIIGHPLILLLVYVFVFAVVFKVRIPASADIPRDYTAYILAGLVPWLAIQQSLNRGASVLLVQANLVKQTVFPIEILPFGSVLVAMVAEVVGFFIIIAYNLVQSGRLPWTFALLPVAVALQILMMTGIGFVLAAVTPFLRDVREIMQVVTVIGVYLIPAFYPPDWVSGRARLIISANPFSHVIWVFQDVLYFGSIAHPYAWVLFALMSLLSFVLGFRIFSALKAYVPNVL